MNKIIKKLTYILGVIAVVSFTGCEEVSPELTELNVDRLFSPIGIEAKVINKTQAVLDWKLNENATTYTIEVFADDSLTFEGEPVLTIEGVDGLEVPYTIKTGLIGQTTYSARVKAVGENISDSKWIGVYFKTASEQIMSEVVSADITSNQVTVHWTAGESASEVVLTTGETIVNYTVTADDIAAGSATITGLTEDTSYSVKLIKGTKTRGSASFTTLMDLTAAGTILVNPGEDLLATIQGAPAGSRIVIVTTGEADEFMVGGLTVELDKSISIRGYSKVNMPIIHAQFRAMVADMSLTVRDVILDGSSEGVLRDHLLQFPTTDIQCGDFLFKDCVIKNYNKSLISGASGIAVAINSISIVNCKVSNILTNSADCIDVRGGCLENLYLTNSTFLNCAPARDFIRLDNASTVAGMEGKSSNVVVDKCTFDSVSNNASRRLLYVRFATNTCVVKNSIVANTLGYYTNQSATVASYSKNNYFNATNCLTFVGVAPAVAFPDISGTHTVLDPQFVNEANGDLTITNTTLIDNGVGAVIKW